MVGTPRVDDDVVTEVTRLGFEKDMVLESLRTRQQNKATVTYWLMCDNRCGGTSTIHLL